MLMEGVNDLATVQALNLKENGIESRDLIIICKRLPPSMLHIDLSFNHIDMLGVMHLQTLLKPPQWYQ
jgi:hypothetical protein